MTTTSAHPGDDARPEPLGFLGNPLPAWLRRRRVTIAPGDTRPYDDDEWRDALVIVEAGELTLECSRGGRATFRAGDVLWLVDIPVVRVRNEGLDPVVIVAVSRGPTRARNTSERSYSAAYERGRGRAPGDAGLRRRYA